MCIRDRSLDEPSRGGADSPLDDAEEECYAKCLEVAVVERKVSTSLLQRDVYKRQVSPDRPVAGFGTDSVCLFFRCARRTG